MTGDEKSRVCAQCDLSVLNASEMTDEEVMMAIMSLQTGKRVCMRIYRRHDGTILTKDCPVGLRKKLAANARRVAAWLAGGLSVLVSLSANAQQTAAPIDAQCSEKTAGKKKPLWRSQVVADQTATKKNSSKANGNTTGSIKPQPMLPMPGMIGPPTYTQTDITNAKTEISALEKKHGPESAQVANRVRGLGMMYYWMRDYTQSQESLERAYGAFEKLGNKTEMHTCAVHLANVCALRKDITNQEIWNKRAESLFPPKTPTTRKGTP